MCLIQGDLDKGRDGPVFMTIHNVGSSFQSMVEFVNHVDMDEVKQRYVQVYAHVLLKSTYIIRTVCPRSSFPIFIGSYYIKWVTTSWILGKL